MSGPVETPRLRLGYLVSQYPSFTHTFVLREILALRADGFDVHVCSLRAPDRTLAQLPEPERSEAATTFYARNRRITVTAAAIGGCLLRQPGRLLGTVGLMLRLTGGNLRLLIPRVAQLFEAAVVARWVRHAGVEQLHTHFASTVAMLAGELSGVLWSATIHGPAEFDDIASFHLAEKVARARRIVTISQYGRSQVLRHVSVALWPKVQVARLGVAPNDFQPPERAPTAAGSELSIVCVARLAPVKGHAVLIEAIALLRRRGCAVRVQLVGDGPDRAILEELVAGRALSDVVRFVGPLSQAGVTALLAEADLFVLASFAEGIPVVLMEAMAMRVPVVASRVMGVPELIEHEVDGVLVPPAAPDALADALADLWHDPMRRDRLAAAGQARVQRDYDLRRNTRQLGELLRRST